MQKKIALLMKNNYMFDFSKRNMEYILLTQKSLWRTDLPNMMVRALRNLSFGVKRAINIRANEFYDIAIIADTEVTPCALEYIKKKPIAQKQYIFFWNKVSDNNKYILKAAQNSNISVSTYNLSDARQYGLEYRRQCWNEDWIHPEVETEDYDIAFLGAEKGRYKDIVEILHFAESNRMRTNFTIISPHGEPYTTKKRIAYSEYIYIVKRSKAVLDIVTQDNYGLTYRPLEAMFLQKKLITNYRDIVQYDFYKPNKDNIFVIGEDCINKLPSFLAAPFHRNSFSMNDYDIKCWLMSFLS